MPYHEGLTYARQDDFQVETGLRCEAVDINEFDGAEKAAYDRCSKSALIGEFAVSEECKRDIFQSAQKTFHKICLDNDFAPGLLDGRVLTLACVLAVQDTDVESCDNTKTWEPVLGALNFEEIERKTGCSRQTARIRLCSILENPDYMRFFLTGGHRYYNTLMAHAIAPAQAYQNLFDILYAFYVENLECYYEDGTRIAETFVKALCSRWEAQEQPETILRSAPLSSGIREMFTNSPHYMAAVCDALLRKIDQTAQGNTSVLDEGNRWDILLKGWYEKKNRAEKQRLSKQRKIAAARKSVDQKENIHPSYTWENDQIVLEFPGLSLPEIQERPVLILYQESREVFRKKLSVFGNALLLSTRAEQIPLDQTQAIDWEADFAFSVSVEAGDVQIYQSRDELYRRYFCFSAIGSETPFTQDAQWLYLIVPKGAELALDGEEDDWIEQVPYQMAKLWGKGIRGVRLNGEELFQTIEGKSAGIIAYFQQNPVAGATVLHDGEKLPVYAREPELVVEARSREETKNYQLVIDGRPEQLYAFTRGNGRNRVELRCMTNRPTQIQIKNFLTKKIIFQRNFVWMPGFSYRFSKPFYYDAPATADLDVWWLHKGEKLWQRRTVNITGSDGSLWLNTLNLLFSIPKIKAELNEMDALHFPKNTWYGDLKRTFLRLHAPKNIPVHVFLAGRELMPDSRGCYEIGAELSNLQGRTEAATLLLSIGERTYAERRRITRIFFQERFLKEPIYYNAKWKTLSWIPESADFIGEDSDAVFSVKITGSAAFEKPILDLRNRLLWSHFPGPDGEYVYTVTKKGQTQFFLQSSDTIVAQGHFVVETRPEERYKESSLVLTEALCDGTEQEWLKIRQDGAVIDYIRFERMIQGEDGEKQPEYSGILYFYTASGWKEFSDRESEKFEKINPVFFVPEKDTLRVYLEDNAPLMLNIKAYRISKGKMGAQVFSRKDELTMQEQQQYLAFADRFHYEEKESDATDE